MTKQCPRCKELEAEVKRLGLVCENHYKQVCDNAEWAKKEQRKVKELEAENTKLAFALDIEKKFGEGEHKEVARLERELDEEKKICQVQTNNLVDEIKKNIKLKKELDDAKITQFEKSYLSEIDADKIRLDAKRTAIEAVETLFDDANIDDTIWLTSTETMWDAIQRVRGYLGLEQLELSYGKNGKIVKTKVANTPQITTNEVVDGIIKIRETLTTLQKDGTLVSEKKQEQKSYGGISGSSELKGRFGGGNLSKSSQECSEPICKRCGKTQKEHEDGKYCEGCGILLEAQFEPKPTQKGEKR